MAGSGAQRLIIRQCFLAFRAGEADVGIEEQGGKVVFGQAGAHPLEIDQVGLAIANDDVLRLEIAVDKDARTLRELLGDLIESGQRRQLGKLFRLQAENAAETILEEVILFPSIK